jgi:hypothetical protein
LSLFDSFPSQAQEQQLQSWIQPAAIVRLYCSWVQKPDKNKYLVIGCTGPEFLMLMVNTDPRTKPLSQTQVELTVANYANTVITGNCFVNCNTVTTQLTHSQVLEQVRKDGSRYRGILTEADRAQVIAAIKWAADISADHTEMLVNALTI